MLKIKKVISGAQTGADRAGIDAAIAMAMPYGGKVPKGRRAEDGQVPLYYEDLIEVPAYGYLVRTEANVKDSDATIVFTYGAPKSGSKRTIEFCSKHGKRWLHVDCRDKHFSEIATIINTWLDTGDYDITLNIAGSRESTRPGIHALVFDSMIEVLAINML